MHRLDDCRSLLFMPASNARALAKARALPCDGVILDLEDAVPGADKDAARAQAAAALADGFGRRYAAIRINAIGTPWHDDDLAMAAGSGAAAVVLPKAERAADIAMVAAAVRLPVIAMIETAAGLAEAQAIAAAAGCGGLIAGTNDLAVSLRVKAGPTRAGLALALQMIVLAAVLSDRPAFDGVCNRLDDDRALAAECAEGAAYGFRGKTLIHPAQISTANRMFLGDPDELAADLRLLAALGGDIGAVRFGAEMVEAMHISQAQARVDRARALGVLP